MVLAPRTQHSYAKEAAAFVDWLRPLHLRAAVENPDLLVTYLESKDEWAAVTVARNAAAIADVCHSESMYSPTDHPMFLAYLAERKRRDRKRERNIPRPILYEEMKLIHDTFPPDSNLRQLRDRALLEVGWFAALERETLAGLHVDDIQRFNGGSTWAVRIRKDRKKGTTTRLLSLDDGINALASVDEWCDAAGIKTGPIFRLARGATVGLRAMKGVVVTRTVKKYVELIGLDPAGYSANSLRHGPIGFGG